MDRADATSDPVEIGRLVDENEQLRASLESVIDENSLLVAERDRLRMRMTQLAQELRSSNAALAIQEEQVSAIDPIFERRGQAEEELRVAFEELQVLTEELEVANSSLHATNRELDARVEQRTRQLNDINDALKATEASLRAVADLVPELLWRADPQGQTDWLNRRWLAYTGLAAARLLGHGWLETVHPSDLAATTAEWQSSVLAGAPFEHEQRIRDSSGRFRWFLMRAEPLKDEQGRIVHWFAAGTDINDQRSAIEALEQIELRFRTLIEGMPQLVWRAAAEGRWTWSSPQWSAHTGQDPADSLGDGWLDAFHPDDRDHARQAWLRAQESGVLEIEGRIFHAEEGRHRHFRTRAVPVRQADGQVLEWLGTSTDVDDILQLHEEQRVLVTELQHRTRNLMAVVQAVTRRTLQGSSSLEQFQESIDDRFSALSRAQGLLSRRGNSTRVSFDTLLREELAAHVELPDQESGQGEADGKVILAGPAGVPLRSSTVQTFALALHELATNAVKYGALSDHGGRLAVTWEVREDKAKGARLWLDWRESGVSDMPAPDAPARGGGYGRELIERALPYQLGARTTYELEPDGIHCTIEVSVPADHPNAENNHG